MNEDVFPSEHGDFPKTKKYISQFTGVHYWLMMIFFCVLRDLLFSRSLFDTSIMSIFFTQTMPFFTTYKASHSNTNMESFMNSKGATA